ncbi:MULTISPECIES: hypothetical protein [Citrobacter]|uniref:hypothetical protein n=1 Tax=Citrobacter TaxID=544 RepID=UPI0011F041E1|nr:hypothetical protein [Citrobacter braakii]
MKGIPGVVRVAGLLGLLLLFIAEAAGQTPLPATPSATGDTTMRLVSTPWHFGRDRLSVPDSLPVGTVIAAAVLPSEGAPFTADRRLSGGLWGPRGPALSWLAIKTALNGVMVRIVPEVSWRGEGRPGDLRIELVKTGVIQAGVLRDLQGMPEYRLWRDRPGGRQVLLRERLVMDRPLTVAVVAGDRPDATAAFRGEAG